MKRFLSSIILLLLSAYTFAQTTQKYCRATVQLDDAQHAMTQLANLGVAVDHGTHKAGKSFTTDFSMEEIALIKKAGFTVNIDIPDVVAYYQQQNAAPNAQKTTTSADCNVGPAITDPSHFHLGSYAGYFTYAELLTILDSMRTLYPTLISAKAAIDTYRTIEGRPIYWIRISNNPDVAQPTKPQVLYTALHHAREPGSISSTVYYLWYLLEQYSTNPQIRTIIDNTELYFIPCINPDGYLYNVTNYPSGGGMWRKNRRANADGSYGVDLNRNYGQFWAYDNVGSSPTQSSETYRGTSAFSEPETRAVKWFSEQHRFKVCLNYHTYNNDLIYPWGHVASLKTNDSLLFDAYGEFLTQHNHYRYGTCDQTLNYITNGGSDDWMYGDTSRKPKIFAFTPEIGATDFGFYTPSYNIIPDCRRNLFQNIHAAAMVLPFANITHLDDKIIPNTTGYLHYNLQRLGMVDTTYTVTAIPLDGYMTISTAPRTFSSLSMLQTVTDSVAYTLTAGIANGQQVKYVLKVSNGFYNTFDTVSFFYGRYTRTDILNTNSLAGWINSGWGVCSTKYYTAPASIGSSSSGCSRYLNNADYTISTATPIDLRHALKAYIYFQAKWNIESMNDYLLVQAARSGGGFSPLCGRHTKPGTSRQMLDEPVYEGPTPHWLQEEIDLVDYLGNPTNIQFELITDPYVNQEGFFFDDARIVVLLDSTLSQSDLDKETPSIALYPNPAHQQFVVKYSGQNTPQEGVAKLYNAMGVLISEKRITAQETTIETAHLPSGLYYVHTQGYPTLPITIVH